MLKHMTWTYPSTQRESKYFVSHLNVSSAAHDTTREPSGEVAMCKALDV